MLVEVIRHIVKVYEPEWTSLFGAKARDETGLTSDYDLPVVVWDDAPRGRQGSDLACQVLRGTGVAAYVRVQTRSRWVRRKHVAASLPATVLRRERLVHAS